MHFFFIFQMFKPNVIMEHTTGHYDYKKYMILFWISDSIIMYCRVSLMHINSFYPK